ncbi:hypothetical protein [Streptomyces sp. NPDC051016]|uniref:hypothetical protein n=1 Tax=Streptomyces sp. NPDC051016 TaxID=3365638 RepID=UPI0037921BBD
MKVSRYWKAIVAAVVAGAGAAGTALDDGKVTGPEAVVIGLAVLSGLGFTWAVPNRTTAAAEPPKA